MIIKQLDHYRRVAPYYADVIAFLKDGFSDSCASLAELNVKLLRKAAARLEIRTPIRVFSEMNLNLTVPILTPGDWGWAIAEVLGANEFINRPGGAAFIDEKPYRERGIKLTFQTFENMSYKCRARRFEPDLSIIDVMMWNSPEAIKLYLDTWRSAAAGHRTPEDVK